MTYLRLPTLPDMQATLARWGVELRKTNFVTGDDEWVGWAPTIDPVSMTITGTAIGNAKYKVVGNNQCFFNVSGMFTITGGVAYPYFRITKPPVIATSIGSIGAFGATMCAAPGYLANGANVLLCVATIPYLSGGDSADFIVYRSDFANYINGLTVFSFSGFYEVPTE